MVFFGRLTESCYTLELPPPLHPVTAHLLPVAASRPGNVLECSLALRVDTTGRNNGDGAVTDGGYVFIYSEVNAVKTVCTNKNGKTSKYTELNTAAKVNTNLQVHLFAQTCYQLL